MEQKEVVIKVTGLSKVYPNITPLRDVNTEIYKGDVISIIGPSGTGKSTFLRCLNRLETPTSGQILVNGVDVTDPKTDLTKVRMKMGMVFQSFNLFPHKMVIENIMMAPMDLLGKSAQEAYDEGLNLLEMVGLKNKALNYPDELSGGQKQRVAIARALAMHPEIILFDEPTSALDPTMVSEVLSVISNLAKQGMTMVIVTHEMRFARDVSTRVFYMDEGIVYEDGSPEQIFNNPIKEKTRNFIFRVRAWNYDISFESLDTFEMLASLEQFCIRQFLSKAATNHLKLAVEELVGSKLLRFSEENNNQMVSISCTATEEGTEVKLKISGKGLSNEVLEKIKSDPISEKILAKVLEPMESKEENSALFLLK